MVLWWPWPQDCSASIVFNGVMMTLTPRIDQRPLFLMVLWWPWPQDCSASIVFNGVMMTLTPRIDQRPLFLMVLWWPWPQDCSASIVFNGVMMTLTPRTDRRPLRPTPCVASPVSPLWPSRSVFGMSSVPPRRRKCLTSSHVSLRTPTSPVLWPPALLVS